MNINDSTGKAVCQICGKSPFETGGYLARVNEKGIPGVWECRPSCDAYLSTADKLIQAIEPPNTHNEHNTKD